MGSSITHSENIEIDISIETKCYSCGNELTVAYENKIDDNTYEISIVRCAICREKDEE